MSPASVPAHSKRGSLGRYLVAGLAGGLFAASLLSFIDWWLMLRQAGRGGGGDSIAALCYAYLLLGPAGICAGLCLALAATMREWYFRLTRAGRMPRRLQLARITFMFSFILGGGALLVYGWMPHWLRTGTRPPWSTGWFFTFLLAGLVVGSAQRFLLCRYADKVGPRVPKLLKAAVAAVLLIMLASAAAGWQLTSGSRNNSRTVWTAPAVAAVNRAGPGSGGERPDGLPVVVLLLDTLRWDALSCYGSSDIRTPHLDRFCREAVQFEVARAQASWTKPSIATLLTSTHPRRHGARGRADRIKQSVPSLAGLFRRAGYRTGAVVANGNLSPAFGFARGFDHYRYLRPDFVLGAGGRALGLGSYRIASAAWQRAARGRRDHRYFKRDAAEVNTAVLEWLQGLNSDSRGAFFLFVNYVDPHDPYFSHPYDGRALGAVDGKSPSPQVREEMAELYGGEVAFLDHHLGRFFAHLRRLGLYDRSLIVVTSDHGEEFLDHGGWWHGLTLYEEQVRVPLLVRLPGETSNGRATAAAGLIDVAPGLLELAGLGELIPEAMSGQSLARLLGDEGVGNSEPQRSFHADELLDGNELTSLIEGRWKYVRANSANPRGLPREALYDVAEDPGEKVNLVRQRPELAAALAARLDRLLQAGGQGRTESSPVELDAETTEHLRALGYLR